MNNEQGNNPEHQDAPIEDLPVAESAETTDELTNDPSPLELELELMRKQNEELKDKYVRLYADFDNFRKRTAKEKIEMIQSASRDVLKDLLPVADDFDRAAKALENEPGGPAKEGIQLIRHKFAQLLHSKGVKTMEAAGKDFDVELHEAITEIDAGAEMAGKVIDEVEKGYYLHDKVLRYAKVVVGKKSA